MSEKTSAELADEIVGGHILIIAAAPFQSIPLGAKEQIIAALRQPASDQVLVPRAKEEFRTAIDAALKEPR